MVKIAVIGSHILTFQEDKTVNLILDSFFCRYGNSNNVLVSGGAVGVDSKAEELSKIWGWDQPSIIYLPENNRWKPRGYMARNLLIAQNCDWLLCVRSRKSKTQGSAFTANEAEKLGKHVVRIYV